MEPPVVAVTLGVVMGSLARLSMLHTDYRQYPSYPQAYAVHVTLGVMASFLGAVAIPAILQKDFAAATFLALAATQFREVRAVERETLANMESTELVKRGPAYIEGIARAFEARNYLAMITAITSTLAFYLLRAWTHSATISTVGGVVVGACLVALLHGGLKGRKVGQLASIRQVDIRFSGPMLTVGDNALMNLGNAEAREYYQKHGVAVLLEPNDPNAKATLANLGQRQAIAHNAATLLGVRKDSDSPQFTPLARLDIDTGNIALVIVPMESEPAALIQAVADTPVLEGVQRKPLAAKAARMVD